MAKRVVIFDAYGTLFDVAAAARHAAAQPGREALAAKEAELSRIWREKQIGYSWWRTVTGTYVSFWEVTEQALDHALSATGLAGDPDLRMALLDLYRDLSAYPEVSGVLADLRSAGRLCAILSNGSPDMLAAAIRAAGLCNALDRVLSAHSVATFKPSAKVYDLVEAELGTPRDEVLFVSSNGWDVAAAAGYGFHTVWVNRAGLPPEELPFGPAHETADLTAIPSLAAA